jgi:hypothetical protein
MLKTQTPSIAGTINTWAGTLGLGGNDLDVSGGSVAPIANQLARPKIEISHVSFRRPKIQPPSKSAGGSCWQMAAHWRNHSFEAGHNVFNLLSIMLASECQQQRLRAWRVKIRLLNLGRHAPRCMTIFSCLRAADKWKLDGGEYFELAG